jgi:phosphoglucosamine mutase
MGRLFGTDGIRAKYGEFPLVEKFIIKLGKAVGEILSSQHLEPSFLIARDTRSSGSELESFLLKGISSYPIRVYLAGVLPTAASSYIIRKHKINLGIIISASHNLSEDNGIKFFSSDGLKASNDFEEKIESLVLDKEDEIELEGIKKFQVIEDKKDIFVQEYINFAKKTVGSSLKGLKVVVDSAHGAVCSIVDRIFEELETDFVSLNNEPQGENINLNCGSQHPAIISRAVLDNGADIGLSFDGDGDRVILSDEKGKVLDGDYIMAISGLHLSKKNCLNKNRLVATVMSNMGLDEALKKKGIKVLRTKVGDKHVVEKMIEENLNLGGEQSGHIVFFDYSPTGDGIITALQVLKIMREENKSLSRLSECMRKFPQVLSNVRVKKKKDFSKVAHLKKLVNEYKKELDGSGRILVRYSGTEPVARLMIEGKNYKAIKKMSYELTKAIKDDIGAN